MEPSSYGAARPAAGLVFEGLAPKPRKVLRDFDRKGLEWTIERGVEQTLGYMEKCGAEEGHLVVIDRRSGERRRGEGEAGGNGRRSDDGRKVAVWTL